MPTKDQTLGTNMGAQFDTQFDSKRFIKHAPVCPGVYQMLNVKNEIIYVGKARNLKNRVASYFQKNISNSKTRALVSHIHDIQLTVTHTENEALILENNLIKKYQPKYNITFRDDKSYPYIYLSTDQEFPRLRFHRGARNGKGRYFGPYPSAGAVRDTLQLLQKTFPIRQCEESFYKNRSRPCLQYQINRCTAPCVDLIDSNHYQKDVRHAVMFLEGKNTEVIDELIQRMQHAANSHCYEQAAIYRDQIGNLRRIIEKQYITRQHGNMDVIAVAIENGIGCVQVFAIRNGSNLGNKSFFPKGLTRDCATQQNSASETISMLEAFIPQYYLPQSKHNPAAIPDEIILSEHIEKAALYAEVLSEQAGKKILIKQQVRGERDRWLKMARTNVQHALQSRLQSKASLLQRYESLVEQLQLHEMPERMECFDISHTSGEKTMASCVVFDRNGPLKSDYRRFNIKNITAGDDYAAMHQALSRRYKRIKQAEGKLPDILFIDGGKGQLSQAEQVLDELQLQNITVIGIAKGADRKPGEETLILSEKFRCGIAQGLFTQNREIILPSDSSALHLIQHIRDEAHRFAITGHRQGRARARTTSTLEQISGLGPKRRQKLLTQLGGLQEITRAGVDDLVKVPGISQHLAQLIYDTFHSIENN